MEDEIFQAKTKLPFEIKLPFTVSHLSYKFLLCSFFWKWHNISQNIGVQEAYQATKRNTGALSPDFIISQFIIPTNS